MAKAIVIGGFDDLRSKHIRFLEEARQEARQGARNAGAPLEVLLWSDRAIRILQGSEPKFPEMERKYLLESIRFVDRVTLLDDLPQRDALPTGFGKPEDLWVVEAGEDRPEKREFCTRRQLRYHVVPAEKIGIFPTALEDLPDRPSTQRKVVVTGCFDWLHSGHVRFFEEVSALGDLYVIVGSDENVRLLKGDGHPLFSQAERRYVVQAVRSVRQAMVSSGAGWMDAEPEIAAIQPQLYAVNEDGDKPEKREFCRTHGLEYVVLQRAPKAGLPRRESTQLRGF